MVTLRTCIPLQVASSGRSVATATSSSRIS